MDAYKIKLSKWDKLYIALQYAWVIAMGIAILFMMVVFS